MNWNQYSDAYNNMIKRATDIQGKVDKVEDSLQDYDRVRDRYADVSEGFNDYKLQRYAEYVNKNLNKTRKAIDKGTRENMTGMDEYTQQLAEILANSKYYEKDKQMIADMAAIRRARKGAVARWLV